MKDKYNDKHKGHKVSRGKEMFRLSKTSVIQFRFPFDTCTVKL